MQRALSLSACALFGALLFSGCDAVSSPPADGPRVAPDAPFAELSVALDDFDRALAALPPETRNDDDAYLALLDETLARHFGDAANVRVVDGGPTERRFGPFNIALGQQQNRFGTMNDVYPRAFDVYVYNVTGGGTAEFSGKIRDRDAEVGALLRVDGRTVDQDIDLDQANAEAFVSAPARAVVGVAYVSTPPGGFPATYEHRVEFQNN